MFQKKLIDQPMMRSVLADMATRGGGRARGHDAALPLIRSCCVGRGGSGARAVLTPAIKYWICKTAPAFVYEAMECLGGNGYVEDYVLARLYRETPVNAIWEGSGNVMGLDLLRASRDGEARDVLEGLTRQTHGLPGAADAARLVSNTLVAPDAEARARVAVERLALLAAAAALTESAPRSAEIFVRIAAAGAARRNFWHVRYRGRCLTIA